MTAPMLLTDAYLRACSLELAARNAARSRRTEEASRLGAAAEREWAAAIGEKESKP